MIIEYGNVYSRFIPDNYKEELSFKKALTLFDQTSIYKRQYRAGYWDGCVRFWKNDKFYSGLIFIAKEVCQRVEVKGYPKPLSDCLTPNILKTKKMIEKWSYQYTSARTALDSQRGILHLATGAGKTVIAAAMTESLKQPTLFLVESIDLMNQTYDVFKSELSLPVGRLGGGYDELKLVTIAVTDSAYIKSTKTRSDAKHMEFFESIKVIFADECHTASNPTYKTILERCRNAQYRFGLSGTPLDRDEISNMRLIAVTGQEIAKVSNQQLIDLGVNAKPIVYIHRVGASNLNGFENNYATIYDKAIVRNEERNNIVIDIVKEAITKDKAVLVLVKKIEHGDRLGKLLSECGIDAEFCNGYSDKDTRYLELNKLRSGKRKVLILSKIGEVGIDVPALDVVVRASGGKSTVSTIQAIGRGLRAKTNKPNVVDYHDFFDNGHKYLRNHSNTRIKDYEREEFEIIYD